MFPIAPWLILAVLQGSEWTWKWRWQRTINGVAVANLYSFSAELGLGQQREFARAEFDDGEWMGIGGGRH